MKKKNSLQRFNTQHQKIEIQFLTKFLFRHHKQINKSSLREKMKHLQRRLLDLKIKMKANLDRFLISGHLRLIAVLTGRVFFFHP